MCILAIFLANVHFSVATTLHYTSICDNQVFFKYLSMKGHGVVSKKNYKLFMYLCI